MAASKGTQKTIKPEKRMSSIARSINLRFCLKIFANYLFMDFLIVMLAAAAFMYWRYDGIANPDDITAFYFTSEDSFLNLKHIITTRGGVIDTYDLSGFAQNALLPIIVVLVVQLLNVFTSLFRTREIRKRLRPLNDLAVKAEALSNAGFMDYDSINYAQIEHLSQAISSMEPDMEERKISTGDKDLESIEIALNNLLNKMRENMRQQARFVNDASHELRTPIAVIEGYVNMLDRWGKEDEEILDESIEAIKNESAHMKELVEQLLFLARGDSGRNAINKVDFDLNEVVKEVWEESLMIDENHKYEFHDMPGSFIYGDIALIKQSIRIFVQNASKYSNEGDTIQLSVKHIDGKICYIVQDEGIGMQSKDIVHIFERFYRSDDARNSKTGGSGLGLSIAKWIIDIHDGSIEVVSRPEFGTRFIVRF